LCAVICCSQLSEGRPATCTGHDRRVTNDLTCEWQAQSCAVSASKASRHQHIGSCAVAMCFMTSACTRICRNVAHQWLRVHYAVNHSNQADLLSLRSCWNLAEREGSPEFETTLCATLTCRLSFPESFPEVSETTWACLCKLNHHYNPILYDRSTQ